VNQIEGWLKEEEIIELYRLAKLCTGGGVIVEIGAWRSRSTFCLAKGSEEGKGVKVYSINHHKGSTLDIEKREGVFTYEEFIDNIRTARVHKMVVLIVMTSRLANQHWNAPIELLFIDGEHMYEDVNLDYRLWEPYILRNKTIIFHDNWMDGPKRVISENLFGSERFRNIRTVGNMTIANKVMY